MFDIMYEVYVKQTPEARKELYTFNSLIAAVLFTESAINENDFVLIEDVGLYSYDESGKAVFTLDPFASL